MIGDLEQGHMVTPISRQIRSRLEQAAKIKTIKIDGETLSDWRYWFRRCARKLDFQVSAVGLAPWRGKICL